MNNPMPPRQAAVVHATVAHLRADPGPIVEHYAIVLELGGAVFKSATDGSNTAIADDGINVIGTTGGTAAVWVRQFENERGADIGAGNQTITIAGGRWRVLPAATLGGNAIWTLSVVGVPVGSHPSLEFTRLDVTANTVAIVNGGPAASTLTTLPVSAKSGARVEFDGTNWVLRSSGLLL